MKKLLTLALILLSLTSFGQLGSGTSEVFVFQPVTTQRLRTTDTVQVFATLVTNHIVNSVVFTQVSGPAVTIKDTTAWYGGSVATTSFWLSGLVSGTYVFKATGLSSSGTTGSVTDTLLVIPDIVCPTVPKVSGITITVFGVPIVIPAGQATKISLSNGTTQTY